jgi:hypothetical protein
MKVIFDFDDVLFNANAFKEIIFLELENEGVLDIRERYQKERELKRLFDLEIFLRSLSFDELKVHSFYQKYITFSASLVNQEMVNLIPKLGRENVFILSQGAEQFQRDKINAVLGDMLSASHILIVPGSKKDEISNICRRFRNEGVIFVDDKVEFLNDLPVSDLPNLKTVLFNHNGAHTLGEKIRVLQEEESITRELVRNNGPTMR